MLAYPAKVVGPFLNSIIKIDSLTILLNLLPVCFYCIEYYNVLDCSLKSGFVTFAEYLDPCESCLSV